MHRLFPATIALLSAVSFFPGQGQQSPPFKANPIPIASPVPAVPRATPTPIASPVPAVPRATPTPIASPVPAVPRATPTPIASPVPAVPRAIPVETEAAPVEPVFTTPLIYEFTELGLSLKMPPQWTSLPASSIEVMNRMAKDKILDCKFTYVAGFERDLSMTQPTADTYPTYILIQETPFVNGATAQQIRTMFTDLQLTPPPAPPKGAPAPGATWLNANIPAIIVSGNTPGPEAGVNVTLVRAYEIITDKSMIGINVYCRSDAGKLIYAEIENVLATMIVADDARPLAHWVEDLKKPEEKLPRKPAVIPPPKPSVNPSAKSAVNPVQTAPVNPTPTRGVTPAQKPVADPAR